MSQDSFKIKKSAVVLPVASPTLTEQGEIAYDSSDDKLKVRGASVTDPVVQEAKVQTLTNKSIDADTNVITNIENADIKAGAAIDATKVGTGVVSNTEFGYLDGVTSAIQTQLNSKSDGAGSSTDNALARFDGVTGKILQNSVAILSDVGVLTGVSQATVGNLTLSGSNLSGTIVNGDINLAANGSGKIHLVDYTVVDEELQLSNRFYLSTGLSTVNSPTTTLGAGTDTFVILDGTITTVNAKTAISVASTFQFWYNNTGHSISIVNEDTGVGVAADRIVTGTGNNFTWPNGSVILFLRDTTNSRWRLLGGASGDVNGPTSSTDNALTRFDGTTGKLVQNSVGILSDAGGLSGLTQLDVDNLRMDLNTISSTSGNLLLDSASGTFDIKSNGTSRLTGSATDINITSDAAGSIFINSGTLNLVRQVSSPAVSGNTAYTRLYPRGDGHLYRKDSTGSELQVDPTIINYIKNNIPFPAIDTNWATYADAAGSSPVDGTGGSPNVTWAENTTAPLRYLTDFKFTKDAANRQGQGTAYAFSIDSADKSKVMTISFDYTYTSGTYSNGTTTTDSDMTVWIYDVTNGVVIQPNNYKLNAVVSGQNAKFQATFQSSTSTSYRLILHVGTTSASAYALQFQNFSVVQGQLGAASALTDMVAYTPTVTGMGTLSRTNAWWARKGDKMRIEYDIATGTHTGVGFSISIPSGYTIDSSKIPTGGNPIVIGKSNASVTPFSSPVYAISTLSTTVTITSDANNFGAGTAGTTWANSSTHTGWFEVPITGWSAQSTVLGADQSRVVSLTANAATGSISGVASDVSWTKIDDTHGAFGTTTYTVPISGFYDIAVYSRMDGTYTVNQANSLDVLQNGTIVIRGQDRAGGSVGTLWVQAKGTIKCVAGDLIKVQVATGGTGVTFAANAPSHRLSINRVSGPEAISASETVAMHYQSSITTSMTSGTQYAMDFNTKSFDTHNAWTSTGSHNSTFGSGSKYTCPVSGIYRVSARIRFASITSWNLGEFMEMGVFKNGSNIEYSYLYQVSTHTETVSNSIDTLIQCNAGDTLQLEARQSSGSSGTLSGTLTENYLSINLI